MKVQEISDILYDLNRDLEEVNGMTEKEVCITYNSDSKQEMIDALKDEIKCYEQFKEEALQDEQPIGWIDEGFANEADYNRYRYC